MLKKDFHKHSFSFLKQMRLTNLSLEAIYETPVPVFDHDMKT